MISRHRTLLTRAAQGLAPLADQWRGASFYVTGGSGFLASSLLAFLDELDRAFQLGIRLYASARRPVSEVKFFSFLGFPPRVEWAVSPVESARLPEVDDLIVIHTASYGSPRDYQREPVATFSANTQGLTQLFQQAQSRRVRQFVYFSSAEIYGQPATDCIPTSETYVGGLDTLAMRSIYGESKRMAEVLGVCLAAEKGIPFTVLRPWNVYGPGQRIDDGRVPIEFIRQAVQEGCIRLASNGTPSRAFCFVWDAMRQLAATLGRTRPLEAFNIGNGTVETTIRELAQQCALAAGLSESVVSFNPESRVGGLQRCVPDTRAVTALLPESFNPTPLREGLLTLLEWQEFLQRHA